MVVGEEGLKYSKMDEELFCGISYGLFAVLASFMVRDMLCYEQPADICPS